MQRPFLSIITFLAITLICEAQVYQSPPPFEIHTPAGNLGLETVSYDIHAEFMNGDVPLRARVTLALRNEGADSLMQANFYLHPDLQVESVEDPMGTSHAIETRVVKYWLATTLLARETTVILPEPINPGDTLTLHFTYQGSLNSSTARGSKSDGYIGINGEKAFLRLFGYCQWLPLIHTMPEGNNDLAMFRLTCDVPESLRVVAPGVRSIEARVDGHRISTWNTLHPLPLHHYSVWVDSWKLMADQNIRVYYHDDEEAPRDYLKTGTEIRNWYQKLYSVGLPPESQGIPYSIVQLDIPSGADGSQNTVGFARSQFKGDFSYSDLSWISHEMIHEYITVPVDTEQAGAVVIADGFNLFFNLPVLEKIAGPEFRKWDLEKRWKQYELGLAGGKDREGKLPPEKALADITPSEYMYYKDRFLTADKEQIILWHLMDMLGEEAFFSGYKNYLKEHRNEPATLNAFRLALEKSSGRNLEDFFHRWFYTTEKLPDEWRNSRDQ